MSAEGLVAIEVARLLALHLDVPMRRAAAIASSVVATRGAARDGAGEACIVVAPGVQLSIDLADVERRLRGRLLDAVESVPRVTRGRPPGRRAVS